MVHHSIIRRCRRFSALAALIVYTAASAYAQTAIRPDQISPGTPDITWGPGGNGYQIGSTVPWRTDNNINPVFVAADAAKIVELTYAGGSITANLPDATGSSGSFGDGFGFTIQTKSQPLTLNRTSASTINGATSLQVAPYQTVGLISRSSNWYASMSLPMPSAQAGANRLADNMVWQTPGVAPPVNTVAPTFTGTATVGSTLTCTQGTWTGAGTITYAFQMNRDGVAISGATASTYVVVSPADQGHTITCVVTASNAGGPTSYTTTGIVIPPASGAATLVQHNEVPTSNTAITVSVPLSGTVAGNFFTVVLHWYSITAAASMNVTSNNGTTFTKATGAVADTGDAKCVIYYGVNATGGPITISSATVGDYPSMFVQEWGGLSAKVDQGVGANGAVTAATGVSTTTSGALTGSNSVVLSSLTPATAEPTSIGANQIGLENLTTSYQLTTATPAVTHTYTFPSQNAAYAIAAFR